MQVVEADEESHGAMDLGRVLCRVCLVKRHEDALVAVARERAEDVVNPHQYEQHHGLAIQFIDALEDGGLAVELRELARPSEVLYVVLLRCVAALLQPFKPLLEQAHLPRSTVRLIAALNELLHT